MNYYFEDIEKQTLENSFFRKVLFTSNFSQLVVMSLKAGEEIGQEIHKEDQFFRIEQGKAKFIIDGVELLAKENFAIVVKAGSSHNVINIGNKELKLYTIYSPAHHKDGTIHKSKMDAENAEK